MKIILLKRIWINFFKPQIMRKAGLRSLNLSYAGSDKQLQTFRRDIDPSHKNFKTISLAIHKSIVKPPTCSASARKGHVEAGLSYAKLYRCIFNMWCIGVIWHSDWIHILNLPYH